MKPGLNAIGRRAYSSTLLVAMDLESVLVAWASQGESVSAGSPFPPSLLGCSGFAS